MPNEFVIKNGFISKGNSIVEGGITATTISASTYSNLPSPSITVGTSQLTSGTDTRVLFQSGTTLQQDGNFTFDPTLKRLTLKAVGTVATDIPFVVQNSAGTGNMFTSLGSSQIIIGTKTTTPEGLLLLRHDYGSAQPTFTIRNGEFGNLIFQVRDERTASTFTVGNFRMNGMIIGGETGLTRRFDLGGYGLGSYGDSSTNMVWENNQGNIGDGQGSSVISVSSNFYLNLQSTKKIKFEAVTGHFGIGNVGTLGARLDVRAQGALSTDIAFRVRNSGDTANIFSVQGDGQAVFLTNTTNTITIGGIGTRPTLFGTNLQVGVSTSGNRLSFAASEGFIGDFSHSGTHTFRNTFNDDRGVSIIAGDQNQTPYFYFRNGRNIYLSTNPNTAIKGWSKTFWIENGSAPTENLTDHFALYSADIVGGNAAPHFRTENGAIVKVYQETTGVTSSTLVSNGGTTLTDTDTFDGYTLKQVVKVLRNLGILQ